MVRTREYDIIIVGGGAAGLAAAVGAKKAGASCLLIERNGCLGGQATNANVASYCGFFTHGENAQQLVYGVGEEVLQELHQMGYYDGYRLSAVKNAIVTLDIEATKVAFDRIVEKYDIDCLLHCQVVDVVKDADGEHILSVRCVDDAGYCEFSAKMFIDASGDANLGYLAGVSYRYGNGEGSAQMATTVMRIDRVDALAKFPPSRIEEAILKAKADGYQYLTKESGIIFRTDTDTVAAVLPSVEVPALDAETQTACEMSVRRQCQEYIAAFRKYLPGMENCRLVWTGNYLGLRDTRHLDCEYALTGEDVLFAVKQEDSIACGGWPCEMHVDKNKMAQYRFIKDDGFYHIPLRCLKVKGIKNLWAAGRTIGADPVAFASVRVMGIGFATGHAAGVAAACGLRDGKVCVSAVQEELCRQKARIR